jgi:hypothetical protein
MAKFTRFDPRNKKANKHKRRAKDGTQFKRIKDIDVKREKIDYEKTIQPPKD